MRIGPGGIYAGGNYPVGGVFPIENDMQNVPPPSNSDQFSWFLVQKDAQCSETYEKAIFRF